MKHQYSLEEVEKLLNVKSNSNEESSKVNEFFQLLLKSKQSVESPCPGSDEDCSDLLSSCCNAIVTTVFGTLPLEVECSSCKERYLLRDMLKEEQKP